MGPNRFKPAHGEPLKRFKDVQGRLEGNRLMSKSLRRETLKVIVDSNALFVPLQFKIDIFSELIIPWNIVHRRQYYFELTRTLPIEDAALMRNADATREIARSRIEGARREFAYRPRAYVVKGEGKRSIFWGPFVSPARTEPTYLIEKPLEKAVEGSESRP